MEERDSSWVFFAGSSHPALAGGITRFLGVDPGKMTIDNFPDGEIGVQILENVRGKDVFLLQSIARRPNHYLMELLIIVDALKRSSARSISVLLPYYGYARQDRKDKGRPPITAKLVADLLEKAGVTRVVTMDLHTEQIQGFFDIPVDNLYARPLFVRTIREMGLKELVIVSPDVGSNKLARKFAEDLKADLAIVDKRRIDANRVEVSPLIGVVRGKNALIVDDICSTGGTLAAAAKVCKDEGAKSVHAFITHGVSAGKAREGGAIDSVYFTDTIPPEEAVAQSKVSTVSVANLFGQVVQRLLAAESISSLFIS
jgi:ribose-phosphate pyrophosphokinase